MLTPIPNLWPDEIGYVELRSPVGILREQANFLGEKTQQLVEGQVITRTLKDNQLSHFFYLVAPKLDHYKFHLLTVEHAAKLYPLKIFLQIPADLTASSPSVEYLQANSEEEFMKDLATVFSSDETKNIIHALLAQSQAEEAFSSL